MGVAVYLAKADQCLAGAAHAVAQGQYNNAANRAYYAAFHAAIAALVAGGTEPPTPRYWAHDFVLREYCQRLASNPADYPSDSGVVLKALQDERLKADYEVELIGQTSAERAFVLARDFVNAVRRRLGEEVEWQPSAHPPGRLAPSSP
jgi:uncharacterized protein (UPF0332 family)